MQEKIHRVKCLLQSTRDQPSIRPEDNKEQGAGRMVSKYSTYQLADL